MPIDLQCLAIVMLFTVSPYIVQAEEIPIESSGLIGGILNQVDSTVKETTKSLSTLVDSTVNGTYKTVEDTFSFTKDVLETVAEPTQKKPISSIVNQTVELVADTVENVKPVVENTTNTVDTVTTEVVDVVEVLPDIPVVREVLEEVDSLFNGTIQTVSHAVETVKELPAQVKIEEPSQLTSTEKPAKPVTPVKEDIQRETPNNLVSKKNPTINIVYLVDSWILYKWKEHQPKPYN